MCMRERERGRVRKVSVETFNVKHDDFLFYLAFALKKFE